MANARNTGKSSDTNAQRRSELAKQMRTASSREERSKAARELSNSRSPQGKSDAGKKNDHSGKRS